MGNKNKSSKLGDKKHLRSKYVAPSQKFLEWVDGLGIERTFFGKLAQYLDERFRLKQISVLFFYCLILAFLLFYDFDLPYRVSIGEIATTDIKSPMDLTIVDEVATEAKRREASNSVPPIFDYDPRIYDEIDNRIYNAFPKMRNKVQEANWPNYGAIREEKVKQFLVNKSEFESALGAKISQRLFEWLADKEFSVQIENVIQRALRQWARMKIVTGPENYLKEPSSKLILKSVQPTGIESESQNLTKSDLTNINNLKAFSFKDIRGVESLSPNDRNNALKLAHSLLVPNVTINKSQTSEKREKARESVLPVQISIKKNQTFVNEGQVVQPIHMNIINEVQKKKNEKRVDFVTVIAGLFFLTLILAFNSFLRKYVRRKIQVEKRDYTVMGLISIGTVALTKIFLYTMDAAFVNRYGIPSSVFLYAAPVMAAPMLMGMLVPVAEVLWLFTIFMSMILGVLADMSFSYFLICLIGGIVAARSVYVCNKRNDIYWAGIRTGVVSAFIILLLTLLDQVGSDTLVNSLLWNVPAGFVGGVLSAFITMTFLPMIESVFNYTTDIKLLELSNLNHPLMQEMVVKAPGTYHHCLVVGTMVEAAAKRIGVNALLGKVMAYYHDIGKSDHAQYFIENQRVGYNPHDHISPYMSKTILIAHVKDGAEMGIEYKLGKPIIDGILQHHGTSLISYFYNKAIETKDQSLDQVQEDDFRYPGPKPQFKEAALVMLADSIEAAARSLDEPTTSRLQNIVKNIIKNKFIDGQLDECDLTLRDLSIIEEAFEHVILGMYHQRIDYPTGPESKISEETASITQINSKKA